MRTYSCPTCKTRFSVGDDSDAGRFRPFCSKRCQLVDLGHWFNESYRVSRPLTALDGEAFQLDDDADQPLNDSPDR